MSSRRGFALAAAAAVCFTLSSSVVAARSSGGDGFMEDFFFRFPEFGKQGRSIFEDAGKC